MLQINGSCIIKQEKRIAFESRKRELGLRPLVFCPLVPPFFLFCLVLYLITSNTTVLVIGNVYDVPPFSILNVSYVYSTVHHLDSWKKIDQLDVTCFIISLFNGHHVSNVSTSILRNLRLIVDLFHGLYCFCSTCVGVTLWFDWGGVVSGQISRKFLRIDVLTSETYWALNNEIKKQVTSSWSIFIQLSRWCTVQ